jgi:hypothetical protein
VDENIKWNDKEITQISREICKVKYPNGFNLLQWREEYRKLYLVKYSYAENVYFKNMEEEGGR